MSETAETNTGPEVLLRDVSFRYPNAEHASVSHVDLAVQPGEFVVLTGGSGSGKTTLTRIMNGLAEQFYEGELTGTACIRGRSISDCPLSEIGRVVGSIFQDPKSQFFASVTEDEVAFGCENYDVAQRELDARVDAAIRGINGDDLRGRQIYPMSSGEKQKVAIASVNAVDPRIYVFDEPSANLDMRSVEALRSLMGDLKAQGHTVIVSEHRLYYLRGLADRFLFMRRGRVERTMAAAELYALGETERRDMGLRAPDLAVLGGEKAGGPAPDAALPARGREVIRTRDVSFSYRKHAILTQVSCSARAGDIVAIVGHNGVGKTTLADIACGIRHETSGEVLIDGQPTSPRQRRRTAYFVMQDTDCQMFGDSVLEELQINRGRATDDELTGLLDAYGLLPWAECHPATLSGGQRQRLTLAVSELMDRPLLLLDEPTSGLDFGNMQRISERLRLLAGRGRCVLVITHDYEFAVQTCTQVMHLLDSGTVEQFEVRGNLERLHGCLMDGPELSAG